MPDVDEDVLHRLAGVDVNDTDILLNKCQCETNDNQAEVYHDQRDTSLVLRHVLAQRLRFWPDVRASGDFGGENAGLVLNLRVVRRFSCDCDSRSAVSLRQLLRAFLDPSTLHFADMAGALRRSKIANGYLL